MKKNEKIGSMIGTQAYNTGGWAGSCTAGFAAFFFEQSLAQPFFNLFPP